MRILLLIVLALSGAVQAQQYPNRPIKFVMAYPPAGSSDVLARPIANEMTKGLGQPVLLEYKPGAGSTIGADFVAKSPPDGYTVVLLLTAHAVNATLMPKLPYDTLKDFTPITLAAVAPLVVEVHADSPIRTVRDLIDAAKASKGKLNYASAGPGNTSHLAVELFKMTVGVDMTHVPYKGSGPAP
jgi:tripartite-type tricarboxylate transporter receptor subunit TctC